ncbi:hypothetical protein EJ110_NYTH46316 [Nymphaea thermarum]|nr:hypothetical protein EJ110_NYTH46316 [Nymphaea thermarum]
MASISGSLAEAYVMKKMYEEKMNRACAEEEAETKKKKSPGGSDSGKKRSVMKIFRLRNKVHPNRSQPAMDPAAKICESESH